MEFIGGPGFKVDSKPPCYSTQLDPEVNDK